MSIKLPSYRRRSGSTQALVTLSDKVTKKRRDFWLGEYGTKISRERYHRLIAQWENLDRRLPAVSPESASLLGDSDDQEQRISVVEIALAFWRHSVAYYEQRAAGHIRGMIRITRQKFGSLPAQAFGPNCLREVRDAMINGDPHASPPRKPWSRNYVNSQIHRLCRMFKWAASHEMIPADIFERLKTVPALRRGRTVARETAPVRSVPLEIVEATRPYLSRQVAALVDLQLLTGARGGELFKIRPIDVDMTEDHRGVWTIVLGDHKTAHHGRRRIIVLGPRAQAVLKPFMANRPLDSYLFSPTDADRERRQARAAARRTPRCGNIPGSNRVAKPRKQPGNHYESGSYRRAISYACDQAFPPPTHMQPGIEHDGKRASRKTPGRRLSIEQKAELQEWRREHRWHPHQLRHTAATLIRREFGLEAAQITLGHSSALVTDAVYAERDRSKVAEVMRKIG